MAKPFRIRVILDYLLDTDSRTGKCKHSQNEISRSLEVSAGTVRRIERALKNYREKNSTNDLIGKNDKELARLLFPCEGTDGVNVQKPELTEDDWELILELLEKPDTTVTNILAGLQEKLSQNTSASHADFPTQTGILCIEHVPVMNDAVILISKLSQDGKNFLRDCSYNTFYNQLRSYLTRKGYSDRVRFKPAEYMEIGALPIKPSKNDTQCNDRKSLSEMRQFLFYAYLPFSRETVMMKIDTDKPDFTRDMIMCLILFLNEAKGLPQKIIGEDRIGKIFKDADITLMNEYFRFCGVMYSTDRRHSVFAETETELIGRVKKSINTGREASLPAKHQERIDNECGIHNRKECIKTVFRREAENLRRNPYPEKHFVHELGTRKVRENNYIYFQGHWYSSFYKCIEPDCALEFSDGKIYFITKHIVQEKEEILSRHLYVSGEESKLRYSTNPEDLAPNDEEARKNDLWTINELINGLSKRYVKNGENPDSDPIIRVAKHYVLSKDYEQQAFRLLDTMRRETLDFKEIDEIRNECQNMLQEYERNNRRYYPWGTELYYLFKKKSKDRDIKSETNDEREI